MHNRLRRLNSKPAVASEDSPQQQHQQQKTPSTLTPLGVLLDMPSPPRERYSPPHDHYVTARSSHTLSKSPSVGSNRRGRQIDRCYTTPSEWRHGAVNLAPSLSLSDRRGSLPSTLSDGGGSVFGIGEGGVCGVLHKWVNYGKGWKPRWFVLNDGVLSFYKLHGPNKISVRGDHDVGGKLIGQESFRRMVSRKKSSSSSSSSRISKPSGEIHLKIASIRVSRSDDKKFSIFTGTRTVRLRAESREAKETWLGALYKVQEQFPRVSNSDPVQTSVNELEVSTEKLRQRLLDDGVDETTIKDCEQIVRNEFSVMHHRLAALKQSELQLVDTLCGLEAEKVELENTVINEEQKLVRQRSSSGANAKSHEGNSSDTEDHIKDHGFGEEEGEEDDDGFFDTKEFLSPTFSGSDRFEYQCSTFPSDEEDEEDNDDYALSKDKHCPVERRTKLPEPIEKEKGVSLWSMIKDNIGKDLTKVCLPVYFNEPISSLQKCCEDVEYSSLVDQAYEYGNAGNKLMRVLYIAAFAVSGYACTDGRTCKPFNPLMGETYEADYPEKGIRFLSEKVSHHPMVIAYHCEGRGWKLWGDCNLKNKFRGRSIQLDPVGILTLEFDDGEVYQWSKVTTSIYNLILGKPYCDHYGTMSIQGNCQYSCKVKFKEQSIIDRTPHQVQGIVQDQNGEVVAKMFGKWNESLHYMEGDSSGKDSKGSQAQLLWKRSKPTKPPNRYNLTRFGLTLNELTPGLEEILPPTDSRLRPDQRRLEKGEYEMAFSEKLRLEEKQRQAREVQENGWKPKWFVKDDDSSTYRYSGGYWEAREKGKWDSCPAIFW